MIISACASSSSWSPHPPTPHPTHPAHPPPVLTCLLFTPFSHSTLAKSGLTRTAAAVLCCSSLLLLFSAAAAAAAVSGKDCYVNIEYESAVDYDLQGVIIAIPLPHLGHAPTVNQVRPYSSSPRSPGCAEGAWQPGAMS